MIYKQSFKIFLWYPEPGSNRHDHFWSQDFKSGVSTDSTIRAGTWKVSQKYAFIFYLARILPTSSSRRFGRSLFGSFVADRSAGRLSLRNLDRKRCDCFIDIVQLPAHVLREVVDRFGIVLVAVLHQSQLGTNFRQFGCYDRPTVETPRLRSGWQPLLSCWAEGRRPEVETSRLDGAFTIAIRTGSRSSDSRDSSTMPAASLGMTKKTAESNLSAGPCIVYFSFGG